MLKYLRISDFAIIEDLSIELVQGLNVLTGETGSGKSLILEALGLLLGAKGSASHVRSGQSSANVEGAFELATRELNVVGKLLEESGINLEADSELIVRREVSGSGRGRIFVNDRLVTLSLLKGLQPALATVQGQGEQLSLFSESTQLNLLDSFAAANELRTKLSEVYAKWRKCESLLSELDKRLENRIKREDFTRFQLAEIDRVSPVRGEDERLIAERNAVAHAERIRDLSSRAYDELYESDESALSKMAAVERELAQLSTLDERVKQLVEEFVSARTALEGVGEALRDYAGSLDFTETRLDELENRLAELEHLKRKHSTDLEGVLGIRDELSRELHSSENLEFERQDLICAAVELKTAYLEVAAELSSKRAAAAIELSRQVEENLESVALERSKFKVFVQPLHDSHPEAYGQGALAPEWPAASEYSITGTDSVAFLFSANPGEPLKPLSEVASGGELSRLFLVLHTIQSGAKGRVEPQGTVVFDEIDVGIGGRVAEVVGRRLKDLAANQQVLCVTHQPQIARFADQHFAVSKRIDGSRTRTAVTEVRGEERVRELIRMVGGKDDVESRRVIELIFEAGGKRGRRGKRI